MELRSTGALGAVFIEQAVSKSGGIYTATGWQISLHLGMEFGPAY